MTTDTGAPDPTRARLIRAAVGLFRRQGVAGSGIGAICARAGVTKGVFAYHFPGGKEDLVVEAIAHNRRDVQGALGEIGASNYASLGAMVEACFAGYAEVLRAKGSDFGCPVAASIVDSSSVSPHVRSAAREAFSTWRSGLQAFDADRVRSDDLDSLVLAALEGAILLSRAEDDPDALVRVGRSLRTLLDG